MAIGFLRRELARRRRAGYVCAVQTGPSDDARTVAERAPGTVCVTVHRYHAPLPPAAAARLERPTPARAAHVVEAVERLRADTDGVVVEAPGGLLDELNDRETVATMAVALGLPLVIVTRPEAGALNAVALTLGAARAHGLEVAGHRGQRLHRPAAARGAHDPRRARAPGRRDRGGAARDPASAVRA